MIGTRLSHFRIVDKLGEGGMGVVYRAEDENLGRHVALKVLHSEFTTDEERRLRFLREARMAASLSHPNIATVHEVDEEEGVIFIAMELVEGRALGSLIAERRPSTDEFLRLAIDITEGLARAHQSSVVHRDLKPDNVVLDSAGRIKILDFGLAKLYQEPRSHEDGDSSGLQTVSDAVTRDGRILGTVTYMSPEQARGLEVDARSDVFSLGILLYELVTGQRPFHGDTVTDTLTSILRDPQPPIARFNPQVPVELERILARCLEKKPADRYQNAGEVLADLRKLKRQTDSQPVPLVSDPGVSPVRSRSGWRRPWPWAAAAGVLVLALLALPTVKRQLGAWGSGARAQNLAVLPFENLQQPNDPDRLGQILQELVITDLSEQETLKVFSSQRLLDIQKQLGRGDKPTIDRDLATEVASRAGAGIMLTGSLSQLGSTWILTCQLIDLSDGSVVKSERIDGSDLYAMVDELTALVRGDLGLEASSVDVAVSQRTSSSLEAYQSYLEGMDALNSMNFDEAVRRFERAIEVDPSFGRAYYKLAAARWWNRSFDAYQLGSDAVAPGEALRQLLGGTVKLTRKDRMLGEAFLELVAQRAPQAIPRFERLTELYPDEKEAWYGLGEARFHGGASREARMESLEPFERSIELDPSFSLAYYHVVDLYVQQRRFDEGIARVREFIEQHPQDVAWYQDWARLVIAKGDLREIRSVIDESLQRIDSRADQRSFLVGVGTAVGHSGHPEAMAEMMQRALTIDTDALQDRVYLCLAEAQAMLGDYDEAEGHVRTVHERDPRNPQALKDLFWLYRTTLRFDEAIRQAKRLIEQDPEFEHYYAYWAEAAVLKGDERETAAALAAGERRVERSSDRVATLKLVGSRVAKAYMAIGDFVSADQYAQYGLALAPALLEDGGFLFALGMIAEHLSNPEQAARYYDEALELAPDNTDAMLGLIRVHGELGNHERAIESGRRLHALQAGPWSAGRLIEALLRAGRSAAAAEQIAAAEEMLLLDKEQRMFRRELGRAYLATERWADAEREIRRAAELDPQTHDAEIQRLLVRTLLQRGKLEQASSTLERALAAFPTDAGLRRERLRVALLEGDAEAAERAGAEQLASGPIDVELLTSLALSAAERGRYAEAAERAQRVVAMRPDRAGHTLLSWTLIAGELDVERGKELAEKALAMPHAAGEAARTLPFVPSPEHCLGLALLKLDRFEEAVEQLERAAAARPDRPSIRRDLTRANELSLAANRP